MYQINVENLLKSGAHFGHPTSKWNPNFKKYIAIFQTLLQTSVVQEPGSGSRGSLGSLVSRSRIRIRIQEIFKVGYGYGYAEKKTWDPGSLDPPVSHIYKSYFCVFRYFVFFSYFLFFLLVFVKLLDIL